MTLVITLYNNDGSIAKRTKGPSKRQLKASHLNRICHAFCAYCVTEAEEYLKQKKEEL